MTAVIKIDLDNAAFEGVNCKPEICRILRDIADRIEQKRDVVIRDINGNRTGSLTLE